MNGVHRGVPACHCRTASTTELKTSALVCGSCSWRNIEQFSLKTFQHPTNGQKEFFCDKNVLKTSNINETNIKAIIYLSLFLQFFKSSL